MDRKEILKTRYERLSSKGENYMKTLKDICHWQQNCQIPASNTHIHLLQHPAPQSQPPIHLLQ